MIKQSSRHMGLSAGELFWGGGGGWGWGRAGGDGGGGGLFDDMSES